MEENDFPVRGILCDIAGTIEFKGKAIEGAINAIDRLQGMGIKILFLTNTDSRSPATIHNLLRDLGFSVTLDQIFTPVRAIQEFLKGYPNKKVHFLTTKEVRQEFSDFPPINSDEKPDFVVLGDFSDDWDVHHLNTAFKYVFQGAQPLGTQGNRYFLDKEGNPNIDTGAFVRMIANAAQTEPIILGKPSPTYFLSACSSLNLQMDEVIIIGDDIESDIQGGINAGIKTILVKTGKGQYTNNFGDSINSTAVLTSIADLPRFLGI